MLTRPKALVGPPGTGIRKGPLHRRSGDSPAMTEASSFASRSIRGNSPAGGRWNRSSTVMRRSSNRLGRTIRAFVVVAVAPSASTVTESGSRPAFVLTSSPSSACQTIGSLVR